MPIRLSFPDGTTIDQAFVQFAEQMLADAGVTQQQADRIASSWLGYATERQRTDALEIEAAADREVAALRQQWGASFDANIAAGRRAVASLGLDGKAIDALDRTIGIGPTMNLLAKMGSRVTVDATTGESKISIKDPTAARSEIERLKRDPAWLDSLFDPKHAKHVENKAAWQDLHAAAFPGPAEPAPSAPTPTPSPSPTPAAPTRTRRDAAQARISQLSADHDFQDRMRLPGPNREAAVQEWNTLHQEAFGPDGGAQ